MSFELIARESYNFHRNENNRLVFETVELETFYGSQARMLIDTIPNLCELSNNSCCGVDAVDIKEAVDTLQENIADYKLELSQTVTLKEDYNNRVTELVNKYKETGDVKEGVEKTFIELLTEYNEYRMLNDDLFQILTKEEQAEVEKARQAISHREYIEREIEDSETAIEELTAFIEDNKLDEVSDYGERIIDFCLSY